MANIQPNLSSFAIVGNLDLNTAQRSSHPPGILSQLSTQNLLDKFGAPLESANQKQDSAQRKVFRIVDYLDESEDDSNISVENSEDFELVSNLVSVRMKIIGQIQQLRQLEQHLTQFVEFIESHKRNIKRLYQNQIILKDTINGVYEDSD